LIFKEKRVKKVLLLISLFGIVGFLAAYVSSPGKPLIQPAEGKLTFAFFYTDG
jgi:hypothetical protein